MRILQAKLSKWPPENFEISNCLKLKFLNFIEIENFWNFLKILSEIIFTTLREGLVIFVTKMERNWKPVGVKVRLCSPRYVHVNSRVLITCTDGCRHYDICYKCENKNLVSGRHERSHNLVVVSYKSLKSALKSEPHLRSVWI